MEEVLKWDYMKQAAMMLAAGVISGKDITSEASVTKLMYLLGRYSSNEEDSEIVEYFNSRRNIIAGVFIKIIS